MTKPRLTEGQQAAADAFFEFLMTADRTFAISGPAGTGKTFLMSYFANDVMKLYEASCALLDVRPEFHEVAFTATTNKAAEVLEKGLQRPVSTIHSYIGLKVKENYRTGKTELQRTNSYKVRRNVILFIDECSMVDTKTYDEIMEAFPYSKIVFVGDHAQMAPVGESLSRVYTELNHDNLAVLTEPVRNAEQPALMALCSQLRDTVETGIFRPILEVDGVINYLDDDLLAEGLAHVFQEADPSSRVLCYTNSRVQTYNEHIREEVRKQPAEFQVGDVLVVASAFANGKVQLSVEREVEVFKVDPPEVNTAYRGVCGNDILYRDIHLGAPGASEPSMTVPVAFDQDLIARMLKNLSRQRDWTSYFDLKASFADLRDKAACTVYKAQGSTYDNVFVDLGNIGTAFDPEQAARMIYVAVSRAKTRVFLYGQLHGRFHNSGEPLWKVKATSKPSEKSSSSAIDETSVIA